MAEGNQLYEEIVRLKMLSSDGKYYKTDAANTELVLNMLAEVATTEISFVRQPNGFKESVAVAEEGAKTAKVAIPQTAAIPQPALLKLIITLQQISIPSRRRNCKSANIDFYNKFIIKKNYLTS